MKIVLLGAPAVGKGTQARKLIDYYKLAYISTGDMLREEIAKGTELGAEVKDIMAKGGLVSDELIIEVVKSRIAMDDCKNGFILDGFPRTKVQAEALDKLLGSVDRAVYIEAPDEVLLDRLTSRETCPKCGATYNRLSSPSKVKGVCDVCQTELTQRKDDTVEAGKSRLENFHKYADALVGYYKEKGLLLEVDGTGDIDKISQKIIEGLGERV